MAGVEAVRVMAVLDDAVAGLRLLSHAIGPSSDNSAAVTTAVGQGNSSAHQRFMDCLHSKASREDIANAELFKATMDLWRHLKRHPSAEARLAAIRSERSAAVTQLLRMLEDLRDHAKKRLTTTVEEDKSVQEHFEDVKLRQEKAQNEKAQLQQKLKLDRMQRQRQAGQLSSSQNTASTHLSRLTSAHAAAMRDMQSSADAERTGANARFDACAASSSPQLHGRQKEQLQQQVAAAELHLQQIRSTHTTTEAALRKARRKAAHDMEAAIAEYDKDVSEKHSAVMAEEELLQDLTSRLAAVRMDVAAMKEARLAHEAALTAAAAAEQRARVDAFTRNRAAKLIQSQWRTYIAAKKKDAKALKKGKGKGKGKK